MTTPLVVHQHRWHPPSPMAVDARVGGRQMQPVAGLPAGPDRSIPRLGILLRSFGICCTIRMPGDKRKYAKAVRYSPGGGSGGSPVPRRAEGVDGHVTPPPALGLAQGHDRCRIDGAGVGGQGGLGRSRRERLRRPPRHRPLPLWQDRAARAEALHRRSVCHERDRGSPALAGTSPTAPGLVAAGTGGRCGERRPVGPPAKRGRVTRRDGGDRAGHVGP